MEKKNMNEIDIGVYGKCPSIDIWASVLTRVMDETEMCEEITENHKMMLRVDKLGGHVFSFTARIMEYEKLLERIKKMRTVQEVIGYMDKKLGVTRKKVEELEENLSETMTGRNMLLRGLLQKKLEGFTKQHGVKFGNKKTQLINAIVKRHGYCLSKHKKWYWNMCPCHDALKDIIKNGKCTCGLFVAGENMKKGLELMGKLGIKDPGDALRLQMTARDKEVKNMIQKGKITILDFHATSCPPNTSFEDITDKLVSKDTVLRKIDLDKNRELANRIGICAIPFVAVFSKTGKPFTAFSGYKNAGYIKKVIWQK